MEWKDTELGARLFPSCFRDKHVDLKGFGYKRIQRTIWIDFEVKERRSSNHRQRQDKGEGSCGLVGSWCQSRCILIKGILCLGAVDVRAERQPVGSLFTASLSLTKVARGGGEEGEWSTEVPPVFRHLLLASLWHWGHCMSVSLHQCVYACELVNDREGEERFQLNPCFSVGVEDQDFVSGNLCICDWGVGRTWRKGPVAGFTGSHRSCEYNHWLNILIFLFCALHREDTTDWLYSTVH